MLKQWLARMALWASDPRRRMVLRALVLALALLAGWLVPQHYALAEGGLIGGGHGA